MCLISFSFRLGRLTIRLTELCQTFSLATHAHHFMLAEVQHLEINAAHSNSKMENTTVITKRVIASFKLIKSLLSPPQPQL